ncbi:MAG: protein translocase subunit SecF [Parcubacteria group bacterium]|jgi:preprotein translocase subunit SecF
MDIMGKRKYAYIFSGTLTILSIVALFTWGLKLGIDFRGGTLMEIQFSKKETLPTEPSIPDDSTIATETAENEPYKAPTREDIENKLTDLNLESLNVQVSDENVVVLRYVGSDESTNEKVIERLDEFNAKVEQTRVDFVGASVSNQLKRNAIIATILALVGIALYIAWAFRKVSYPVTSWQYGICAIIALLHDIIITIGFFVLMGRFFGIEVGVSFIAALLTILGYSVNDTIVVYDRIRENLIRSSTKENFENITNRSIMETLARSFNTAFTVIIVLIVIVLFGGESIKYFSLALLVGIGFGTYSSVFVASALLVSSYNRGLKTIHK